MQRELILGAAFIVVGHAALVSMMLTGAALADPGGMAGLAMLLGPVLATALLAAVAWWRPRIGAFVAGIAGLVAVAVAFANAWVTGLPDWFGGYANVVPVAAFVVIAAFAAHRPRLGGAMLLTIAVLVGIASPDNALFLVGPAALAGVLFLAAGRVSSGRRAAQPA